jgi:hypothetical protein
MAQDFHLVGAGAEICLDRSENLGVTAVELGERPSRRRERFRTNE